MLFIIHLVGVQYSCWIHGCSVVGSGKLFAYTHKVCIKVPRFFSAFYSCSPASWPECLSKFMYCRYINGSSCFVCFLMLRICLVVMKISWKLFSSICSTVSFLLLKMTSLPSHYSLVIFHVFSTLISQINRKCLWTLNVILLYHVN